MYFQDKSILIVGSFGHGNVGDDSYIEAFKEIFKTIKNSRLTFLSDTVKLPNSLREENFDCIIVGGGGLLTPKTFADHTTCNLADLGNLATLENIPLFIISVGFQYPENKDIPLKMKNFLMSANFICMRSPQDMFRVQQYVPEHKAVSWAPDLVYSLHSLYPQSSTPTTIKERTKILILVTDFMDLDTLFPMINKKYIQGCYGSEVIIMNWGGKSLENYHLIHKIKEQNQEHNFPFIEIVEDLKELYQVLLETNVIVTGRFHGKILGKVFKVPYIETFNYQNYKFSCNDNYFANEIPIEILCKLAQAPLTDQKYQKYLNMPREIPDRNSSIVEKYNKLDKLVSTKFLQNWDIVDIVDIKDILE